MKRIILPSLLSIALSISATFNITAQTGPGGVDMSDNILWLDASQLNLNNGDPVNTWTDLSSTGNDAVQLNSANQPIFQTNQINGLPSIQFDGNNDYFLFDNNITTSGLTVFLVSQYFDGNSTESLLQLNKHHVTKYIGTIAIQHSGQTTFIGKSLNTFSVSSIQVNSLNEPDDLFLSNKNNTKKNTRTNNFRNSSFSSIGYFQNQNHFDGGISEILIFNNKINSARRKIISEYLSGKYNLTSEAELYEYTPSFGNNIIGVGQESDGNQTVARGSDSLLISNPTTLSNGDYLIIGNNNAGYSTSSSVGGGIVERWNQVWRADKTGTPGTVDLEFFLGGNGFSSVSNYVVLIENEDGDFSNGGTSIHEIGRSYDAGNNSIKFTNIDLADGAYFTLAEKTGTITSTQSGDWNSPSTWSCNCIPDLFNEVTISNGDEVTISANSSIKNLTIDGSLSFNTNDTLDVYGDIIINNGFSLSNGVIQTKRTDKPQVFTNNSGDTVQFHSLIISNDEGLSISNGHWSLIRSLQVNTGDYDVNSANSFTLVSNASTTAEILPSIDNAFSGEFTIQRYISNRQPNYADLSAPTSNATALDLDDEDELIVSGINGSDSDITFSNGDTFYSMFLYDANTYVHNPITSTSTPLSAGDGFELYLLSTSSTFTGANIDFKGTPNNGNVNNSVYWRWNLVGNPYQSHIDYDAISKSIAVKNEYMIFDANTGTYNLYSGSGKPLIAPGQGFWVYSSANYAVGFNFKESNKVSSNSSALKRMKNIDPYFSLNISNNQNPFSHKMRLAFDAFATEEMDEKDALHLPSPIKEAPAIYSKAVNSEEELIVNSLNPTEESQLVPVSIYAGVEGEYEISADNLDALYDNYSCVYLKDEETEKAVDLMVEPKYSFEAKQGKSDRFQLILSNSYEECQALLKEGEFVQDFDQKLSLRNAYKNWYVDYTLGKEVTQLEIRVYNMSGQEVKAPMNFEAHGAGTYPLQHLNDLEGIYLIQIVGEDIFLNKQVKL